jgi:hypothetical protein
MEKNIVSKANIVGEAYKEILDTPINKQDIENSSELEIEQANELINPDPNSLDSRG